jgi:hypothetical protein
VFRTFASSSSASYNIHEAHYGAGAAFTLGWGNDDSGMPFDGPLASTSSTAASTSILHGWSPPAFTPSPSFTVSTSASTISQRPGSGLLTPSGFSHHEAREGGTIDSEPSVELTFSGLSCETNAKTTDAPTLCEADPDTLSVSADFNMTRAVQEVVDEMRFAGLPTGRLRGIQVCIATPLHRCLFTIDLQDENGSHVGTALHLGARTNDGITASPISAYEYNPSSSLTRDRFGVALPCFTTVYPHVAFTPMSSAEITRYSPLALHHPQPLRSFSGLGLNAGPDMTTDPLRLSPPATHVYEPSSQVRNGVLHYSATGPFSQTVAMQSYERRPLSSTVPHVPFIVPSAYPPVYSQSIDQNDSHGRTGHVRRNCVGVTPYGATPARTYASARLPLNVRPVTHASSSTGPDIYAQGLVHMEDRPGQSAHHDPLAQAFGSFSRPAAAMPTVETYLRLDVRESAPAPHTSFNALAFPPPRAGPYGVLSPFQSGQPSREQIGLAISAAKRRHKLVHARTSGTSSKTEVFPMHAGFDIPPYQAPDVRQLDERLYPHRSTHNVEATAEFVHSHLGWYEDGQKTATVDQNKLKRRGPISAFSSCVAAYALTMSFQAAMRALGPTAGARTRASPGWPLSGITARTHALANPVTSRTNTASCFILRRCPSARPSSTFPLRAARRRRNKGNGACLILLGKTRKFTTCSQRTFPAQATTLCLCHLASVHQIYHLCTWSVRRSPSLRLTDLSALVRKGSPNWTASTGP